MASPRLQPNTASLLVIDVQERLMPTIANHRQVEANAANLLRMASVLGLPYLVTEQYPRGLGRTIESVAGAMPDPSRRIEKTRFSAAIDLVTDQLAAWRRDSVIVCGVEAHVCVLQTVLDLLERGFHCFVCTDAISAGQHDQVAPALRRMERAGATPTGVISAMYEMMADSTHPSFKACLDIAKDVIG